jgi:hypothetical protein
MRYKPFDLQEWLANPKAYTIVRQYPDGKKKPLRDFTYFPNASREGMFAAVLPNGNCVFLNAGELAFELPDLPPKSRYVTLEARGDFISYWHAQTWTNNGEIHTASFSGPNAKERAQQYVDWMNAN